MPNKPYQCKKPLKLILEGGAYAGFEEMKKEAWKLANWRISSVLDGPILDTDIHRIQALNVDMTIINGRCVYDAHAEAVT